MKNIHQNWLSMAAVILLITQMSSAMAQDMFSSHVDVDGNISLPIDFRINMVHLGSWYVPDGGASGFHDVYTEKKSAQAYRETGKFPDGATLVKELRADKTGSFTTGEGVGYATDLKQWFVMIKDTTGRFSGNPLWGEGWGWALFKPDAPAKNVATSYKTDCLGCHIPAKANDWVYSEAYPTLHQK